MASLVSRITSLFRRQAPPEAPTTTLETPPPPRPTAEMRKFTVERDRRSIVELCRRMVDEDPRAEGNLKTLARDATRGGFSIKVTSGPRPANAQAVAKALIERLGLVELITDWVELTTRDGDSFLEVSVDAAGDIVKVSRKPTLEMHRNSDDFDVFPDPTRAYWWADTLWGGQEAPQDATWFADWQIIHARWSHDEGCRYGRPLFASSRKAWKRIDEGETDIAIRRKTRAGMKYNHKFPDGTDAPTIEGYKEQNQDALDNPTAAIADFFGTTEITPIEGDARLGEITDVVHHIRTWWLSSPVPMSLLGYGQDLNRDVLQEQKQQYDRALDAIASWIDKEIIQPLVELQWRLKGIWPGALTYEIIRPSRHPLTAADLKAAGDAIAPLKKSGLLVDELLLQLLAKILPGLDAAEALRLLKEQQAEQEAKRAAMPPPPPAPGTVPPPNGQQPPAPAPPPQEEGQ